MTIQCRFVDRNGSLLATVTADLNGEFRFGVPPDMQGFIGCNPPGFPHLILITFVSTVGIAAGETIPEQGREEVSPPTTIVANIIAQTAPAEPQARKRELLAALEAQDPDITTLVGAATELFNALHRRQITDIDFSAASGESGEDSGGSGAGSSSGSSSVGVTGEFGDGTEGILGTSLPRMVRTGRFRVAVRDTTGAPVPNVRVGGVGRITAASECQDTQGRMV